MFFKNFNKTIYNFGDNESGVLFQVLNTYADLLGNISDDIHSMRNILYRRARDQIHYHINYMVQLTTIGHSFFWIKSYEKVVGH